jgi:hypothetical protein
MDAFVIRTKRVSGEKLLKSPFAEPVSGLNVCEEQGGTEKISIFDFMKTKTKRIERVQNESSSFYSSSSGNGGRRAGRSGAGTVTSKFFPRARKLGDLDKVDLVYIARCRGSPLLIAKLEQMTYSNLIVHISELDSFDFDDDAGSAMNSNRLVLTEEEERCVAERERKRNEVTLSAKYIKYALKSNSLPVKQTTGALVQAYIDAGMPSEKIFIPDKFQQEAINASLENYKTIILAGAGSGKTMTLCHLASTYPPHFRVLVLAYNRGAELEIKKRMAKLQNKPKLIPKKLCSENPSMAGILILTFDKYVHNMRNRGYPIESGSYDSAFEHGLLQPLGAAESFDVLILDEAQDVSPKHRRLLEQIFPRVRRHIVIKGDLEQEICQGASWFSSVVHEVLAYTQSGTANEVLAYPHAGTAAANTAYCHEASVETYVNRTASDSTRWALHILRTNHRSSEGIIAAMNFVRRRMFPRLHHTQLPPPAGADGSVCPAWESAYTRENEFGQTISFVVAGEHVAEEISRRLLQYSPSEVMALTPVSIEKWKNDSIIAAVRQSVYASGSSSMVLTLGDGTLLTPHAYYIGTARTAKGSERDHVIVFAADNDYTENGIIAVDMFYKMLYVCMSRARKTCTVVLKSQPSMAFILNDMIPEFVPRSLPPEPRQLPRQISISVTDAAKLSFWARGTLNEMLNAAISTASRTASPKIDFEPDARYSDNELRDVVPDADIVGLAVEAAIANHASLLGTVSSIRRANTDTYGQLLEAVGLIARYDVDTGTKVFELVFDGRNVRHEENGNFVYQIRQIIETCEKHPAYLAVILQRSAEIGAIWTMSERLMDDMLLLSTSPWAAEFLVSAANQRMNFQSSGMHPVFCHRSDIVAGWVIYRTDFEILDVVSTGGQRIPPVTGDSERWFDNASIPTLETASVSRVIEVKHCIENRREHAAQAAMYASYRAAPCSLVNTRLGTVIEVPAINSGIPDNRLRAYFAFRNAMLVNNLLHAKGRVFSIPHLARHIGRPIVVVDIEGGRVPVGGIGGGLTHIGGEVLVTEIGAVCFDFALQDKVIDCFHMLTPGCFAVDSCGSGLSNKKKEADENGADSDDEEDCSGRGIGSGSGTLADPWIPYEESALGAGNLRLLAKSQEKVKKEFHNWWKSQSFKTAPLIVKWAGADDRELGIDPSEYEVCDARNVYRWYLEQCGAGRNVETSLSDAALHLLGPDMPFVPHRAFEDAVITAAILICIQRVNGQM